MYQSTTNVLPRHGLLAWNLTVPLERYYEGKPSLSGEPECLHLQESILTSQVKTGKERRFLPQLETWGYPRRMYHELPSIKLILIIEDNPGFATRLGRMLVHQSNDQIIVASDCLTALKFLRSCTPDLMLVDERLLMHNGIDLAPRIRMMKDLQDIPLLLFSAVSLEVALQK